MCNYFATTASLGCESIICFRSFCGAFILSFLPLIYRFFRFNIIYIGACMPVSSLSTDSLNDSFLIVSFNLLFLHRFYSIQCYFVFYLIYLIDFCRDFSLIQSFLYSPVSILWMLSAACVLSLRCKNCWT